MNLSRLKVLSIRVSIMIIGLAIFFNYARFFQLRSYLDMIAFTIVILLIRLTDEELSSSFVSFDSAFTIAAILLFPLPEALLISIGSLLIVNFIIQEKVQFGGPLYLMAEKSLVIFASGLWMNGQYLLGKGVKHLSFFSMEAILVIGVCVFFFGIGLALKEVNASIDKATPFWPSFVSSLQLLSQNYLALASIGVITALMYFSMGIYTLFLFLIPLLVVRFSFKLFLDIKDTYHHTIAALSRVIEAEDSSQRSHSERVADLSTNIAKEMGLAGNRLEAVSYAALLHDIGRLGLDADSFDAYLDTNEITEDQIPHALIGAEILEQVEFLSPFAPIVAKHHIPFSPNRRQLEKEHPLESRIIAVANYFDQLIANKEISQRLTHNQAVAKIKKEAFQFDPKVVRSLINVLKRQGRLISVR